MRLDISVGPVQGFVAKSRRTRDLWGSSYLLSFLSAHAMLGARDAGGEIDQSVVNQDRLLQWVQGQRRGEAPKIGSVPNHFVVTICGDAPHVARAAIRAFDDAWKRVCRAVWNRFVAEACSAGMGTDGIWNRQVNAFWEVTWTVGPCDGGGGLLARRKHWRSQCPPDEHGDKCTVMHNLQEMSGYVGAESRASRQQQGEFWRCVRNRLGRLDLDLNERLCAIALIKRLFPKVAEQALGWRIDTSHWPSTVYVSAVPWIRRVVAVAPRLAREYAEAVKCAADSSVLMEHGRAFKCLANEEAGHFAKLDANFFHSEHVQNEQQFPLSKSSARDARYNLTKLLAAIYGTEETESEKDGRPLGAPPTFYALILADGDRLGELVGELGMPSVGRSLAAFTNEVPQIVSEHDGVTIYAGGDDVMAMLPVPKALECAASLSDRYRSAFPNNTGATLSAAVVYAQVRIPLRSVLNEARRLLDHVAKDCNGRDSLAAAVLKPGGMHCQWVTTWDRIPCRDGSQRAVELLQSLARSLATRLDEPGLSTGLIYRIRETFATLTGWDHWQPGQWGSPPAGLDTWQFLRAEIAHSLAVRMEGCTDALAAELTDLMWNTMGRSRAAAYDARTLGAKDTERNTTGVGIDALLLARFLSEAESEGNSK